MTRALQLSILVAVALVLGIALVLLRGEPTLASDQGVYLSTAARLLDGDRLYADVVAKDPLFFYAHAAALGVGGWRGAFLLDGIWLAIAAVAIALLLRELRAPRSAVVAGFFVYPLALTSGWYQAGLTMLAALAIAPLAGWLWLRGRFAAAGALVGAVMLFKLNLAAVAAAPLAAFAVLGAPNATRRRPIGLAAAGLAAMLGVSAVVLALRGELRAYIESFPDNVYYSSALVGSQGTVGRFTEHLQIVVDYFRASGRWQLPVALLVLAAFAFAVALAWIRRDRYARLLGTTGAFTLAATLVTLGLTAYWSHHLQMLAYPAALVAAALIAFAASTLGSRAETVAAVACVVFALWSSLKLGGALEVSSAWSTSTPHNPGAVALERARMRLAPGDEHVPYLVFGGNSENAHAVSIGEEFDLACRWFHLYPDSVEAHFEETLNCANRQDPQLILVTLGFFDSRAALPSWGKFVESARRLLETRYERVETEHPGFEVWARKPVRGGAA